MKINNVKIPFRLWLALKIARLKEKFFLAKQKLQNHLISMGLVKPISEQELRDDKMRELCEKFSQRMKPRVDYNEELVSPTGSISLKDLSNNPEYKVKSRTQPASSLEWYYSSYGIMNKEFNKLFPF